jgi:cytochrome c556
MKFSKIAIAALFGTALVATGTPVLAQSAAEAIAARQAAMRLIGGNMSALKLAIDSKDANRLKQVEGNARAIAASADALGALFPKGSDKGGNTKALPAIWEKMADFKKAWDGLKTEATAMADAAKAGDVAKATSQFGRLGAVGCGGCHTPFRAK